MIEDARTRKRSTVVLLFLCLGPALARTAAAKPFGVVCDPANAPLEERVRGQLDDVGVEIEWREPLDAGDASAQLLAADAIAARDGARAVVWFAVSGGEIVVSVASPEARRIFIRAVGDRRESAPSSATLETVALVVRGALRALAQGAVIGVGREALAEPAPSPPKLSPPPPPPRDDAHLSAMLGWNMAIDGAPIHPGPNLRLSLAWRRVELGLTASVGFPVSSGDALASFTLTRWGAGAWAGAHLLAPARFRLLTIAEAGVVAFHRTTQSLAPIFIPTSPRTTASPCFSLLLEARVAVVRGVDVALAAGADLVPLAPDVGYAMADGFRSVTRIWPVQPRAQLGILVSTQ